jgi:hypothetical protein
MKILNRIIASGFIVLIMSSVCFAEYPYSDPIKSNFYESILSLLFVIGIIVIWLHWIYRLRKASKNIAKHIDGDPKNNASVVFKALYDALNK